MMHLPAVIPLFLPPKSTIEGIHRSNQTILLRWRHMGYIPSDAHRISREPCLPPILPVEPLSLYETTLAYYSLLMITHLPSLRPPSRERIPSFFSLARSLSIVLSLMPSFSDIFSDISLAERAGFSVMKSNIIF